MKNMNWILELNLFAAVLLTALPIMGEELDFSQSVAELGISKNAQILHEEVTNKINPATGKNAVYVSWDSSKSNRSVVFLKGSSSIQLSKFAAMRFQLSLTSTDAPSSPTECALRLVDNSGEKFEFVHRIKWEKKGVQLVTFDVSADPVNSHHIWDGDGNKKMDFPIRLAAVSFVSKRDTGRGELYINAIKTLEAPQSETSLLSAPLSAPIFEPEKKNFVKTVCGSSELSTVPDGNPAYKLSWDHPLERVEMLLCIPGPPGAEASAPLIPNFRRANFKVEVATDRKVSVERMHLMLIDALGERFVFSQQVRFDTAGNHQVTFHVDAANPDFSWSCRGFLRIAQNQKIDFPVRLFGLAIDVPENSSGELFIKSVSMHPALRLADAIDFKIETGNPARVLEPGHEKKLEFQLVNKLSIPIVAKVKISQYDFCGIPIPKSYDEVFKFRPGECIKLMPEITGAYGIRYVDCTITSPIDSADTRKIRSSFAYMKPAGMTPGNKVNGFIFGMNSHPERLPSLIETEAIEISQIGAKVLRFYIGMPEEYKLYDEIIEKFAARGMNFDLIISPEEAGYRQLPGSKRPQPDFIKWRKRVGEIFQHYKGRVQYWELMNEPDVGNNPDPTPEDYLTFARIAREELKKIDPDALFLSAGFCNFGSFGTSLRGDFQERVMEKANGIFDLHCFHGHWDFPTYSRQSIEGLLLPMRQRAHIKMPWYANETALSLFCGVTEQIQARALFKKLLFSWSRGSVGYNWYNLRNKGMDPQSGEMNYGALNIDDSPKAVYVVFNTLTTLFRGAEYVRQLPLNEGRWAFEFKNGNRRLIAVWSESSSRDLLYIDSDASNAEVFDLMGNAKPAEYSGQQILLPVTQECRVLVLDNVTKLMVNQPPVTTGNTPLLIPGQRSELVLTLKNSTAAPRQMALTFSTPPGISTVPAKTTVDLPASGSLKLPLQLQVAKGFKVRQGIPIQFNVDFRFAEEKSQQIIIPLTPAIPISKFQVQSEPLFTLDRGDQVISIFQIDPGHIDKIWSGPEDLSATVRVGVKGEALEIYVDVTDDIHDQPYAASFSMLQGDSIRMLLEFAGQPAHWEYNFALCKDRKPALLIGFSPPGFDRDAVTRNTKLVIERKGTQTVYRLTIPFSTIGITEDVLTKGFRFNMVINDSDHSVLESYAEIAPGIAEHLKTIETYPLLILMKK